MKKITLAIALFIGIAAMSLLTYQGVSASKADCCKSGCCTETCCAGCCK